MESGDPELENNYKNTAKHWSRVIKSIYATLN
jgi:hypothetical protein